WHSAMKLPTGGSAGESSGKAEGKLNVEFQFHSSELQSADLPVEVLTQNMRLAGSGLASTIGERLFPAGTYFVSATLPAGQQLVDRVVIPAGGAGRVVLSPDPSEASPHESEEVARFFRRPGPAQSQGTEPVARVPMGGAEVVGRLRRFVGDPLRGVL